MREPKYRVWIKSLNKYLPIASIDFYYKTVLVWGCGNENCGLCDDEYSFDDVIFEQYTGLHDKNGKEIYEGDIVRCCAGEHYRGTWEFQSTVKIKDIRIIPEDLNYSDVIEIIGNIHENPELLEVD